MWPADRSPFSVIRILQQTQSARSGVRSRSGRSAFCAVLQDAAADGTGHIQQLVLPDEPELCLVLIRKADRQLRGLERVAEACGLDAEVQHLAVRQDEDLLPGAGDALHVHQKDAVRGKDCLVAHGLVRAHDGLAV